PAVEIGWLNVTSGWSPGTTVTLTFEGLIRATLVDALSVPLGGQLVVARAAGGLGAGKAIASSFSDASGLAELVLPNATAPIRYAVYDEAAGEFVLTETNTTDLYVYWTRDGSPSEVMIGGRSAVSPSSHVLIPCAVFYAKFLLVSDTGRALERAALKPAEPMPIRVTYYLAGRARPDIFSLEGFAFDNATFRVDRCPIGEYLIEAWWPRKAIKVYEALTPIESNIPGPGAVEVARKLKCLVYDIVLNFKTPRGTACANATATVKWPQGVVTTEVSDLNGNVALVNVPVGKLTVMGLTWRGFSAIIAPKEMDIASTTTYYLMADNIVTLNLRVLGARGQGLPYAAVAVERVLSTVADESGLAVVELPRLSYTVSAMYKGKSASKTIDLTKLAPGVTEYSDKIELDVWMELFGYAMSAGEFALSIVLLIIVAFIIAFIVHEYVVWRRKRIAAAVVKT
ncbi:MAG: hypothetical protein QXT74_06135, partial [Candidatus Nezhaarchaeales archaeon]